ncbi:hypothetical protein M0R45_037312 [Rubus argutus]|uniref:Uncharacterized protein n=1 Tax=Rubus argutus TaxID=59490 RepID=A0AAW1VYS7_RUBAR
MVFNPFAAIASPAPCPQSTATRTDADLSVLPTLGVDSTSPSITSPSLCHRRSQGGFATPKSGHPSISSAQTPYPSSPLLCAQPDVAPSPLHPASSAPTPPISGNKPSPHSPIYMHGLKTTVQPPFFAIAAATFGFASSTTLSPASPRFFWQ